jgi:hypothetical protein
MAWAVDAATIGLPANRAGSTWMSAAMTTASAAAMSSAVSAPPGPSDPWVSIAM